MAPPPGAGGDPRVVIAVLDGPVQLGHPCLQGARLTPLQSLIPAEPGDGPATSHGTHVTSVLFGQPGTAVAGIAPRCTGLIIPIFSDGSNGERLACTQLDLARAILLAVDHGAHIINISGGQLSASAAPEPLLAQAIETCARRNVLVVAAAGNDGCDCLHIPAAIETVLAVGAMDETGRALASSNWGAAYLKQGLLAPGRDVLGADAADGVIRRSGTSFAAPYVAGVAALLLCERIAQGRPPDPQAIRVALLQSAAPCIAGEDDDCRRVLSGRIDVDAAFKLVTGGLLVSDTDTIAAGPLATGSIPPAFKSAAIAGGGVDRGIHMSEDASAAPQIEPSADLRAPSSRNGVGQITPSCGGESDCGCGGGNKPGGCSCGGHGGAPQKPQLVYAIGRIGYDFGSEARRDSFMQAMSVSVAAPFSDLRLLDYLAAEPYEAPSLIWTLNLDATPVYAIAPVGAYAAFGYEKLREAFDGQCRGGVELVSVPGVIGGSVRLQSGQVVPVIVPALRGMFNWSAKALVEHALGARPAAEKAQVSYDAHSSGLNDFLNRVYYDLRNLGITAEERAINYSATNAVQISNVLRSTTSQALDLDTLHVKRSPVCRPDSECYDVELSFFNPNNTNIASRIFRFTVDVSDVIPVSIGETRSWTRR